MIWDFLDWGGDRDQGSGQANIHKNFQDPLQGIGGPMIRSRANWMKDALEGLIKEVQEKEVVLEDSKTSTRLITYFHMQDDGLSPTFED